MRSLLSVIVFTVITGCSHSQANFSKEYIHAHSGKSSIVIPEVQELVHIIFAITEKGIGDSDMVNHEGNYYKEVMEHFLPFAREPLTAYINQELKGGIFYGSRYSRLKMDACGFYFDGDRILKDTVYPQLNWDNRNYIAPMVEQLEAFALQSGFRKFYQQHKPYYDTLIKLMHTQLPVQQMWKWLEQRFPARYDNYRITFSPLANGQQSTNHFENNGFKQCVMFICGPFEDSAFSPVMEEGLMSKVAFTEIDHNYVNPVTDSFRTQVDEIFADRSKWTAGKSSSSYKTSVSVFNEYMTYATYILYLHDHFSATDFTILYQRIHNQMENQRGFIQFKSFTDKLIELYKYRKQPVSIAELYPYLLGHCKQLAQ